MKPSIVPPGIVAAVDYEFHAHERLPADVWAYIAGGGADGLTQRWNREAFDRIRLAGRVLADLREASTRTRLFGLDLDWPLILAPVAHQRLVHPEGERATALGASAARTAMCVSTLASTTIEEIAGIAQTPLLFQLYLQPTRGASLRLVRRAEAAGYRALMVTVDAPVNGVRNMEQRTRFQIPPHAKAVNLESAPAPILTTGPGESPVFRGLLSGAPRWDDIEWLRGETTLPLLIKGIMHPLDAERAIDLGADGIVISNHGGRTLDTLPASIEALEVIAAEVRGRVPLLLDGGIRRGTDILKALALGASAVMIGQPQLHALAVAGAVGIAHLLTILRSEFEVAMALTGCATLADISRDALWPAPIRPVP
jgi:4-hydroxymandelate oxidase